MIQLTPQERKVARAVLKGRPLKHVARQWVGNESKAAAPAREATKRETIK